MAIAPGNAILASDLVALATAANSVSSTGAFDLSGFYDVVPNYNDGSGNPWGHRELGLVAITARGSGYKLGDSLAVPITSVISGAITTGNLEVVLVDDNGGVLGLLPLDNGAGAYDDTFSSPAAAAGGSGTGCMLSFIYPQIGPGAAYSFADVALNSGRYTGAFLNKPGSGYTAGDTLTATPYTITVNTVDAFGAIVTWTAAALANGGAAQIQPQPFIGIGGTGSGATFGSYFTLFKRAAWLTELNRLRGALGALNFDSVISPNEVCVSGPWPVAGITANFLDTWFYYADTGMTESVTLNSYFGPYAYGPFATATIEKTNTVSGVVQSTAVVGLIATSKTWSFVIGGIDPIPVSGYLFALGIVEFGQTVVTVTTSGTPVVTTTPDTSDPIGMVSATADFPCTINKYLVYNSGNATWAVYVVAQISATLSPGTYNLEVTTTPPASFSFDEEITGPSQVTDTDISYTYVDFSGVSGDLTAGNPMSGCLTFSVSGSIAAPSGSAYTTVTTSGHLTASFTYSTAITTPGVHNAVAIKKINLPGNKIGVGAGIGVIIQPWISTPSVAEPWANPPYPQPVFGPVRIYMDGLSASTTVPGYWTAYCEPVSSLNNVTPQQMPWNQARHSSVSPHSAIYNPALIGDKAVAAGQDAVSNSYDNSSLVEYQQELPPWKASTYFSAGFCIVSGKNIVAKVITAGTSSYYGGIGYPFEPSFATAVGGTVSDGTVVWQTIFNPITEPDGWIAGKYHALGDTLIDSNGNTQACIDTWQPLKTYALHFVMVDSNGNAQQVTTAGTSQSVRPIWSTTPGGNTNDGSVVWITGGPAGPVRVSDPSDEPAWSTKLGGITQDLLVTWQLTKSNTRWRFPTASRRQCIPKYPVYWSSETLDKMKPPTSSSGLTIWGANNQWQRNNYAGSPTPAHDNGWQADNQAAGWWIYSVSLNRSLMVVKDAPTQAGADAPIGMGDMGGTGIGMGDMGATGIGLGGSAGSGHSASGKAYPPGVGSGEVSVTIGCMRSGSFVAFGTYVTGQTVQVLWPVFTSDALVYQASERVDVQAVAIAAQGGSTVSVNIGNVSGWPMAACNITDTLKLLQLIS